MNKLKIPQDVHDIVDKLNFYNYPTYIVGGAVRDLFLGNPPHDWDLSTMAYPKTIRELFDYIIPIGEKFGTMGVSLNATDYYEVTTFRKDGKYIDGRHPEEVTFSNSIEEDLARRDFTINAIAIDIENNIIDPFNGFEDINKKIIRCVGNPDERFQEDPLRILRALRFAVKYGFEIEKFTSLSIHDNASMLSLISKERIFDELSKILISPNPSRILNKYSDVFSHILPIEKMLNCEQNHPYHVFNVWHHTLKVIDNVPPLLDIRFAALFHDIGKPECKTTDEDGVDHFLGHADKSKEITIEILKGLNASNNFINNVSRLVEYHVYPMETIRPPKIKKLLNEVGIETVKSLALLRRADIRAQNPDYIDHRLKDMDNFKINVSDIIRNNEAFSIKDLNISGKDIIEEGVKPGETIGKILNTCLVLVTENILPNDKEILKKVIHIFE